MKAKVARWGNSLAIRLPKTMTEELGLLEESQVECEIQAGRLIVRPIPASYTLDELVSQIDENNRHSETDWGPSQGAEFP